MSTSLLIQQNIGLKPYNTFGIDVYADYFTIIDQEEQLPELKAYLAIQPQPVLIIGGGSNILFTDHFHGLVVLNALKGIHVIKEDKEEVQIKVASGENWHQLVMLAVKNGWSGIENLALIPGSVGAAPIQNIGAYGAEIRDVLLSVETFEWESGKTVVWKNSDCCFAYRDSVFKNEAKGKYFITNVLLQLKKHPTTFNLSYGAISETMSKMGYTQPSLEAVAQSVIHIRQSKLPDPQVIGNAGSFFKNPIISSAQAAILKEQYPQLPQYLQEDHQVKLPAAWLIEFCGWKGKKVGQTGNHSEQALVIVNYGNATGRDIKAHALAVQQSVVEKFGVKLEPEVNFIPD